MMRIVITNNGDGDKKRDFDESGKVRGRGAYICDDENCIKKLRKQKVLNRVFETAVSDSVYDKIEENFFGKKFFPL